MLTLAFVALALQAALAPQADAPGLLRYLGLFWLAFGTLVMVLAGFEVGVGWFPLGLTRSQVGGIGMLCISLGWLSVPVASTASFGWDDWLWIAGGLFFVWSGVQMFRGHDEYRFSEPGEDLQSKRAERRTNANVVPILRDEALRSIGVFGLLFIPTILLATLVPGLDPATLWIYVPAVLAALCNAVLFSLIRIRTGAGPFPGQILHAAREYGWLSLFAR